MQTAKKVRGLIVVDKPRGVTSRKVLNAIEERLDVGPLGHCGSLDPLATGVLVLVVGAARKIQDLIVRSEKVYDMTVTFGARSETDDAEGPITPAEPAPEPRTREQLQAVLPRYTGEIQQRPPTFSAVKVEGKRMHREARKGRPLAAEPRPTVIHELEITRFAWPDADLHMRCGSGTYARAVARDLGEELGCGAYMSRLVRTRVGALTLDDAVAPDDVTEDAILGIESALKAYPRVDVPLEQRHKLVRGQTLRTPHGLPPSEVAFAWCGGEVVSAITFLAGGRYFRTKRLLV